MAASKIRFEDEDLKFINEYKEATGVSLQRFVTEAIKEKITNIKAQQVLDDAEAPFKYVGYDTL